MDLRKRRTSLVQKRNTMAGALALAICFSPLFIAVPNASAASSQVWCSTNTNAKSTLSWTTTDTATVGRSVTFHNFSISTSDNSNPQYSFAVTGATPSSLSLTKSSNPTNFGDLSFNINGSAGSPFSVRVSDITNQVIVLMVACSTTGSVAGSPTFFAQTIAAQSTTTNPPATVPAGSPTTNSPGNTNDTTGTTGTTTGVNADAPASQSGSGATPGNQIVVNGQGSPPPSSGASSSATTGDPTAPTNAATKSTPRHKDKWWMEWLKSGWFWFSVILVAIPEFLRWHHKRKLEAREAAVLDAVEEELEEVNQTEQELVRAAHEAKMPQDPFTEVIDELKELSGYNKN